MRKLSDVLQKAALLLPILVMLTQIACDGSSTGIKTDDGSYRLTGLVTKDLNSAVARVDAVLLEDGTELSSATLAWDNDTLSWSVDKYSLTGLAASFLSGSHLLTVIDGSDLTESIATMLPGNLAVEVTNPANRLNPAGQQVTVDFTAAAHAEGYAVAAVLRDSAYTGFGYSAWVTDLTTGTAIPPEAFRMIDGDNPDPGWYYIYIYAYTGLPDSSLSYGTLPVPLPTRLGDNIDLEDLDGHIGGLVVCFHDSVQVPQ